jgi:hypothetical protein
MSKFSKTLNLEESSIVDVASSTITYIGKALPGTATSAANWKISRIDTTTGVRIMYAGNSTYTQIWDNRASLTYS